jgi:catechol 2,3-dioxygenase-like lactoylglutathione lyase family enzyme
MAKLVRVAPELPVADLEESLTYYVQKLGFSVAMQMADYAIVDRDDVALHLFLDDRGRSSPVGCHIFSGDLEVLMAEFKRNGAMVTQEIERKPWGNLDFRVKDASGNELKFTEPLGEG